MKDKKVLSDKAYTVLSVINALFFLSVIAMLIVSFIVGGLCWMGFGAVAVLYIVFACVFGSFEKPQAVREKDSQAKAEKEKQNATRKIERDTEKMQKEIFSKIKEHTGNSDREFLIKEKERIEKEGLIFCSEKQLESIINTHFNNLNPEIVMKCPICWSEVSVDNDSHIIYDTVEVKEEIKGAYVPVSFDGQVVQAYKTVEKTVERPVTVYNCPRCQWQKFYAEYKKYGQEAFEYEDENYRTHRDTRQAGYKVTAHKKGFIYGKIYDKVKLPESDFYNDIVVGTMLRSVFCEKNK